MREISHNYEGRSSLYFRHFNFKKKLEVFGLFIRTGTWSQAKVTRLRTGSSNPAQCQSRGPCVLCGNSTDKEEPRRISALLLQSQEWGSGLPWESAGLMYKPKMAAQLSPGMVTQAWTPGTQQNHQVQGHPQSHGKSKATRAA